MKSYKSIDELVSEIFEYVETKYESVAIVAYPKVASAIMDTIFSDYVVYPKFIHYDIDYEDEYAITIDENYCIYMEPIKDSQEYSMVDADMLLLHEDIKSSFLRFQNENCNYKMFEVANGECDYDCCEECSDELVDEFAKVDEDTEIHGFTIKKNDGDKFASYSFYTSEIIDKDDIRTIIKDFGF